MRDFDFKDVEQLMEPYMPIIRKVQERSFSKTVQFKDMLKMEDFDLTLKPRSKGGIISDCIKTYLENELKGDPNAIVLEINSFPALFIGGKILVRFNKMDEKFHLAIQKRRNYWSFVNQGERLEGFAPDIVKMWAGFIPVDKEWSDIGRYFLVCFDAGQVVWFNDLAGHKVEQLALELTKPMKKRSKVKERKDDNEQTKTGTEEI